MEKLLTLGETSRSVSTFGIPVLTDTEERMYQTIQPAYEKILRRDNYFDRGSMKAFDFKLKRALGKKWPEPPRVGDVITFESPLIAGDLCTGVVKYVHLGRRRSVGLVYLDEWRWLNEAVPDFTSL